VIASPVPIRGGLLVRGDDYLYMFGPDREASKTSAN